MKEHRLIEEFVSGVQTELSREKNQKTVNFVFLEIAVDFFKTYADIKFGKDVMTFERLDGLFASPIISHLLVFTDSQSGAEAGVATDVM